MDNQNIKPKLRVAVTLLDNIFKLYGTTNHVLRILEILNLRYEVTIINCSPPENKYIENLPGVRVLSLIDGYINFFMKKLIHSPLKLFYIFSWNPKLALTMLNNQFDIIYCAWDFLGFLSVYPISKIKRYKIIFEAHSVYSAEIQSSGGSKLRIMLTKILEQFVISRADSVIALSKNTMEQYKKFNKNIYLIPVFVDTDLFKRSFHNEKTESKLIGLIGPFDMSIRNQCQLKFLYDNLNIFDEKIKFLIIGKCDWRISTDRIQYTGYIDSISEYANQISKLNAVLVPEEISTTGIPNKILEPMSCGVPVFTTFQGILGLSLVRPGEDILVFSKEELATKINQLIDDDAFITKIGNNARRTVEKYYSKSKNEENILAVIQNLMNQKARNKKTDIRE